MTRRAALLVLLLAIGASSLGAQGTARDTAALRRLESPEGGPPALYGELRAPASARATRTVVLYAHYDGQPVDRTQWTGEPWTPVLRDGPLERGGREIPWPRTGNGGDGTAV